MGIARGFFVACLEDAGGAFSPVVRCKVDLIETLTALGQADENSDKSLLSGPCDATLASFCFPLGASCLPEWRKKPPKVGAQRTFFAQETSYWPIQSKLLTPVN